MDMFIKVIMLVVFFGVMIGTGFIKEFFDEENFCEGEFEDLAAAIFSDIVNIEPEEL